MFAVLGNHDLAVTRDPFVEPTNTDAVKGSGAVLLRHETATFEARGRTVQIVGSEPFRWRAEPPDRLVDRSADLRILLAHFPDVVEWLRPGSFHLALAGHLHGGQICLPSPWGKLGLEHVRTRYREGLYETPAGRLYVSRGLGTSFVPLRLLARPEATKLVLRTA
jgi:predicted MPP superfamily phosphohydrolase